MTDETMTMDPAPKTANAVKWRIPMDAVKRETATLPDDQRDALSWICQYGIASNLTLADVAAKLTKSDGQPYSHSSLYAALTGRRNDQDVSLDRLCEAIARFRRRLDETSAKLSTAFIETPMSRSIFRVCRRAIQRRRITFVFGPSQVGKTAAATEYARLHNHGETVFVRMPTGGALTPLMAELALRFSIHTNQRVDELTRRIYDCFDERVLLIVDEAHQCLLSRTQTRGVRTLEWIRELHDRRNCGVVLIGTDALLGGLKNNPVLGQIWRRRSPGSVIRLPAVPPTKDLNTFASAFGLDPAPDKTVRAQIKGIHPDTGEENETTFSHNPAELQREMVRDEGLGSWVKLLEDAQSDAKEANRKLTWAGVLYTYCLCKAVETY